MFAYLTSAFVIGFANDQTHGVWAFTDTSRDARFHVSTGGSIICALCLKISWSV